MRVNIRRRSDVGMPEPSVLPIPQNSASSFRGPRGSGRVKSASRMKSLRDEIRTDVREKEDGFDFIVSKANDFIRALPGFHRAEGAISLKRKTLFPHKKQEKEIAAILKQKGNVKPESSDPKRSSLPKSLETIRSSRLFFCFATVKKRFRNAAERQM